MKAYGYVIINSKGDVLGSSYPTYDAARKRLEEVQENRQIRYLAPANYSIEPLFRLNDLIDGVVGTLDKIRS